jgi:hypothetical protein
MKRSLLFACFTLLFAFWAQMSVAQCTPDVGLTDPEGDGAMAPDTLEAWEESPINTTLTIICPTSADVGGGSIPIHHITIKSITNKPAWLSYACNPGTCEYAAGVNQCALVTGTPPSGSAGTIYMKVLVDVYMDLGGTPVLVSSNYDSGDTLVLIIHPPIYVEELTADGFGIISPAPNPFISTTRIGCYTENAQMVTLDVFDMIGNLVSTERLGAQSGENYFQFSGAELNAGVYFYRLTNERDQQITRKLVKSN